MQMTKVNIGAVANDGTGDPGPRGWMDVMNRNFSAADSALARVGTADTVPNLFDLAETRVTALPHIYTVAAGTLVPTIDRVAGMPCWKAVSAAAGSSTVRFSFDAALFTTGKVAGSVRFLDVSAVSGSPKVTLSITQHNAAGNQVAASAEVMVADQTGLSAPIDVQVPAMDLAATATAVRLVILISNSGGSRTVHFSNLSISSGQSDFAPPPVPDTSGPRIDRIESALPTDFLENQWPNGDLAEDNTLQYTGSGVLESVAGIADLASLGIVRAFRPTPPAGGSTGSQLRTVDAQTVALGMHAGDNLLVGTFVYASDGATFPASHGHSIRVGDVITALVPAAQWLQVTDKVRFYWAKGVVPAGVQQQVILGFAANRFVESAAVRYHGGFYLHSSTDAIPDPTLDNLARFLGWDHEGSNKQFFDQVSTLLQAYQDGSLGAAPAQPRVSLGGDGANGYVEVVRDGKTLRRVFAPFPPTSLTAASVFNFIDELVDGVSVKPTSDDAAPYRVLGTTIGANHGYAMNRVTAAAHGKTQADVGSVYSDGASQHVIVGIASANALWMTNRDANGVVPGTAMTWVSGGTNHANIAATAAAAAAAMFPPFNNRSIRCFVDGVEVTDHSFKGVYQRSVAFVESYDILAKADVVASIIANGSTGQLVPSGDPSVTVSITYTFDFEGNCTINTDFLALKDGLALQDIMFLQSQRMSTAADGAVRYYIPKTLPAVIGGRTYNYALIDDSDTTAWATRLSFTPDLCEPAGMLPDRVVQLTDHYGFAIGYLPVQDTAPDVRRANASVKALQLSTESGKIYLSAIDKGAGVLNTGDYFSTIGYRNLLVRKAARTDAYTVRTNGATYLYADWHAPGTDRVPVPPDLAGRAFEVVEKSANVAVLSKSLTNSLVVKVTDAAAYGYLILKVT